MTRMEYGDGNWLEYHIQDCLGYLQALPDNAIDLILTDPPYGIGESNKKNSTRGTKQSGPTDFGEFDWDQKRLPRVYFTEMQRVAKNQIIFGGNYYIDYLYPTSCWIVWDKDLWCDFADCELAWTSFKTATRKVRWRWSGMLQEHMDRKEPRVYPTQKPIPVFAWIIENYSQRGDTILDPFLGSGTTLAACRRTGRNGIGIEKRAEAEPIIRQRIMALQRDLWAYSEPLTEILDSGDTPGITFNGSV